MRKTPCVRHVCCTVRKMVIRGDLPPGSRINESALSRRLNVSRTPLREALNRLAGARVVGLVPGGGFCCPAVSPSVLARLRAERADLVKTSALSAATMVPHRGFVAACLREEPMWRHHDPAVRRKSVHKFLLRVVALTGNGQSVAELDRLNRALGPTDTVNPQTPEYMKEITLSIAWRTPERLGRAIPLCLPQALKT